MMLMEIDLLLEEVKNHPLFLRLKSVIENIEGYHDNEDVYSHLVKTARIAKEKVSGNFIENEEAKEKFVKFTNEEIGSVKKRDLLVLLALLHDIGKILSYKENGKISSINWQRGNGQTSCPGHEYLGSTIIGQILKDLDLNPEIISFIEKGIRLHDTFSDYYFATKKDWPIENVIIDTKARGEGIYKEVLFNVFCDCFDAKASDASRPRIIELFSTPSFYTPREYFLT